MWQSLYERLQAMVRGAVSLSELREHALKLQRFVCDSPRKRRRRVLPNIIP
jgi:hypothetical protein